VDLTTAALRLRRIASRTAACAAVLAAAASVAAVPVHGTEEIVLTPGVAARGVRLEATVDDVRGILGAPSGELRDPTNSHIIIQRWESLCLGARYTETGNLVALDVWTDLGEQCGGAGYAVDGAGGRRITFASTRADVKAAFGYAPSRVLAAQTFTIFVYDDQGIAFYLRDEGPRRGLVDAMTVFRRGDSPSVWAPASWGGR
jgi:hypothetical protein